MHKIILRPNREKSVFRHHPWIFSGAINKNEDTPENGDIVQVISSKGEWLATGTYSNDSQISVRIWSFNPEEKIAPQLIKLRLEKALRLRSVLIPKDKFTAYRLVYSESDGLPGVIVDYYAGFLICQFTTAGADLWKKIVVSELFTLFPNKGIYERSNSDIRIKEGLPEQIGVLSGMPPPELIEIQEGDYKLYVDVKNGYKTGAYLEQRENRLQLTALAANAEVLNCFSYTGGFAMAALKGNARHVTNVDTSAPALEIARKNLLLNEFNPDSMENLNDDVFQVLRQYQDAQKKLDIIILDPPQFMDSRSHIVSASRNYKDINLRAIQLLRPGGMLLTFSRSGRLPTELFLKIVAESALDAGREVKIIRRLSQSADFPVAVNFPEGQYLKGLICRVE